MEPLLLIVVVIALVGGVVMISQKNTGKREAAAVDDAKADARQAIERLGGQVFNLVGSDTASKQALADASERYTAAGSQIDQARTSAQARLAKQTALEGLYYIRAARLAMGMDPGPDVPTIDGQKSAGEVTEERTVDFEGRQVTAAPAPSEKRRRRTTTPVAAWPVVRCPPAGIPNPGGSRPSSRAPGASGRCSCSPRCSRAWPAWDTTRRRSRAGTATATRTV